MRLIFLAFLTTMGGPYTAKAQDAHADAALHCAALITLSGDLLAADGQASKSDLAQVHEIATIMLQHSTKAPGQRAKALKTYVADYRRTHSVEQISQDVQNAGDSCIENYLN